MRVLLHNRRHQDWQGGDSVLVKKLQKELLDQGIDATYKHGLPNVEDYDLIHLNNISMGWTWDMFKKVRKAKKRIVISTIFEPGFYCLVSKRRQQRMAKEADFLITISNQERHDVLEHLDADPGKAKTIKIGIYEELAAGKALFNFGYVLHVGRIEPRKNQLAVVTAVRDKRVVLVGEVFDTAYYRELIQASGDNVIHISFVSRKELFGLYKGARVFCFPSRHETCGMVNLEAGLSGCQVITSDVGGIREYCGEYVTYVEPDDTDGIGQAVDRLWNARNEDFGEFIRTHFSWERCAREYKEVYLNVMGV